MVFNSLTFIAFFALVLGAYHVLSSWHARKMLLLIASYAFYAAWNPPFVVLLWISTLIDWFAARGMAATSSAGRRRILLFVSLAANLGMLGFFKYGEFLLHTFVDLVASLGIAYSPPALDIVLPVGISFYTFQTLSYTIDVYRGNLRPSRSFLDFALYVTFFPQLVAGPIVRAVDFLPQCETPRRASEAQLGWGLVLLTIGLFEKTILADGLMAPIADLVYEAPFQAGFIDAWTGTLAFSAQIFFDFAGYSTCAIGVALCLGFALPDNFRYPYAAIGFSDFWRRWHISLSTWLRDYLYIPLGGNRARPLRVNVNLIVTMLLGGLWHGAAWRFVAWGGLHGLYLTTERGLRRFTGAATLVRPGIIAFAAGLATYALTCITWVFFRAEDFPAAFRLIRAMTIGAPDQLVVGVAATATVAIVTAGLLASHWWMRDSSLEDRWALIPWWTRSIVLASLILVMALARGDDRAFIYFQF